ncbi:hypothetical protein ABXS71_19940 [Bacillus infantis]|uniref:hypothetical protein n=1 Tax=Bacillus infantis TaxID=324767 RepID=UPI0030162535
MLTVAALVCFICTILLGLIIRRKGNNSKIEGIAVFVPFAIGMLLVKGEFYNTFQILIGGAIVVAAGWRFDMKRLSVWWMLSAQMIAALIVIYWGRVEISFINTYLGGVVNFYALSIPLTLLFLLSLTNSVHYPGQSNALVLPLSALVLAVLTCLSAIKGDNPSAAMGVLLLACIIAMLIGSVEAGSGSSSLAGFIIAIIILSCFKGAEIIYIPLYLIGVPSFVCSLLIRKGADPKQSINISLIVGLLFSLPLFILSPAVIWGAVILASLLFILTRLIRVEWLYR